MGFGLLFVGRSKVQRVAICSQLVHGGSASIRQQTLRERQLSHGRCRLDLYGLEVVRIVAVYIRVFGADKLTSRLNTKGRL